MTRTVWSAAGIAVVVAAAVTRFAGLGQRFFHHDEAIHAWTAHQMTRGAGYYYDPVYHGPLLYHLETAVFEICGTGDAQSRMVSAVCGVVLVGLLVRWLGPHLGTATAVTAGALAVISPTLTYYSRFNSHDVLIAVLTVAIITGPFDAPRAGLIWGAGALALAMATKLNAYFLLGTLGLYLICRVVYGHLHRRPLAVLAFCRAHVGYLGLAAGCALVLLALLSTSTLVYYINVVHLPIASALVATTDSMLFGGFRYWWAVHQQARLGGPFHYYLPILATYEPVVFLGAPLALLFYMERRRRFLLAALGAMTATWTLAGGTVAFGTSWLLAGGWAVASLWNARREFLACWLFVGVVQLFLYSFANEKVPWLAVHIVLPWLVVVAAWMVDVVAVARGVPARAGAVLLMIAVEVLTIRTSWIVNTRNRSDVAEPLVQLDYGEAVPGAVRQVRELAVASGGLRHIVIEPSLQWPFAWYFRDLNVTYLDRPVDEKVAADILITSDRPLPPALADRFTPMRLQYHHWTTWIAQVNARDLHGWLRFMRDHEEWGAEVGESFVIWIARDAGRF